VRRFGNAVVAKYGHARPATASQPAKGVANGSPAWKAKRHTLIAVTDSLYASFRATNSGSRL
jgi:hypothetical protein